MAAIQRVAAGSTTFDRFELLCEQDSAFRQRFFRHVRQAVGGQQSLARLAQTSQRMRRICEPYLYQHVVLSTPVGLLRFSERNAAATLLRYTLSLAVLPAPENVRKHLCPLALQLFANSLAVILRQTPHLYELDLWSSIAVSAPEAFGDMVVPSVQVLQYLGGFPFERNVARADYTVLCPVPRITHPLRFGIAVIHSGGKHQ
ncbi:hypothetical protein V8E36_000725 [Tilletia maclaganii]